MKESISYALRWASLPLVLVGVFTVVHILWLLFFGYFTFSSSSNIGRPPYILEFIAGAAAAGASLYACQAVAPAHKRKVVWITGILCISILTVGIFVSAIVHGGGSDFEHTVFDNTGSIIGAILTMRGLLGDLSSNST